MAHSQSMPASIKQEPSVSDVPDLAKSQSRVSQRSKPANFYSNLDRGIGDTQENKDFPGNQK